MRRTQKVGSFFRFLCLAKRKRASAQPKIAKRKRASAQPKIAKRKRASAQPKILWLISCRRAEGKCEEFKSC